MKQNFSFLLLFAFVILIHSNIFSQTEKIRLDTVDFNNTAILFEKYERVGKLCKNNNGIEKHCLREEKLLDNNYDELIYELESTLSYLQIKNELISKEAIDKEIYNNKSFYRYVFSANPKISKKGNSCFSNPGSLIFFFDLYDRLEDKTYAVELDYAFFICDIQILVNDINKNLKKAEKKRNN